MNHSASATWKGGVRPATSSLKKTIQAYRAHSLKLTVKLEQLEKKKRSLEAKAFVVLDEMSVEMSDVSQQDASIETPPMSREDGDQAFPHSDSLFRSRMEEGGDYYHSDDAALVSQATGILMESIKIRLSYVEEALGQLMMLYRENPKMKVPLELTIIRYEEWVRTNQRLFVLNSQLYDLEKTKFVSERKKTSAKKASNSREEVLATSHRELQSHSRTIQSLLARYRSFYSASSTTQAYLQEVLSYRGGRMTLEAQKVQEFVNDCLQNSRADTDNVVGAHPQNYQNFMAVLCNYIVERQRDIQGDEIPFSTVYNMVEHIVVPQVQHLLLRYVQDQDKDLRILQQCDRYRDITLTQLNVRPAFVSKELEPFTESIAHLRASVFSPTPTGKMSAVVGAAKALYDQLSSMGKESIDGDSFLDLWIYVTLKANIPELATNVQFMVEYGNPSLNMDEAGYYLTTLHVASNFIENLTDEGLKKPVSADCYVVCERSRARRLCGLKGSCVELVQDGVEMRGYKMAVLKDWVLDRSRLYCSVLVESGDHEDVVIVSTIRFSSEGTCAASVEYFSKKFTSPQTLCSSLSPLTTPIGQAVTMDMEKMDRAAYFFLDGGDFDSSCQQIERVLLLIRLGSESTEKACDSEEEELVQNGGRTTEDQDFIYVFTPPSQDVEDSLTHRQLLQHSYLSEHEHISTKDNKDNLQATEDMEGRPKSLLDSSSVPVDIKPRVSSDTIFTPSPYLVSYSPRREISLQNLPPPSPSSNLTLPDLPGAKKHKNIFRNKTVPIPESPRSPETLKRHASVASDVPERSFLRKCPQAQLNDHEGTNIPQIQVVVDNDEESLDMVGNNRSQKVNHKPVGSNASTLNVKRLFLAANDNSEPFIVRSDDPSNAKLEEEWRFVKSDLHEPVNRSHRQKKYLTAEGHQTRSPSLRRWTENIRSRLSSGRNRKKNSKKLKDGWEELRGSDSSDSSLVTPYQLKKSSSQEEEDETLRSRSAVVSSGHHRVFQPVRGSDRLVKASYVTVKIKDPGPEGFLRDDYVEKLEENFRVNHLFGRLSVDVDEGMVGIVRQAQVYLQHLNYLSLATEVDGSYSNLTLIAVRRFQEAHNRHESGVSVILPENGRLTPVSSQFLRQAFITVYASLHRLNALSLLGEEFDPTSTKPEDVRAFRRCVEKYQAWARVVCPCGGGGSGGGGGGGVLCPHTIARISEHIRHFHVN